MSDTLKKREISNMSIAIDPEMKGLLKRAADKKNMTTSRFVRSLIEKYVNDDNETYTIVLRIPRGLDSEEIKNWLEIRCKGIIKALSNE